MIAGNAAFADEKLLDCFWACFIRNAPPRPADKRWTLAFGKSLRSTNRIGTTGLSHLPPCGAVATAIHSMMNQCLILRIANRAPSVVHWVVTPTGHSLKEATRRSV